MFAVAIARSGVMGRAGMPLGAVWNMASMCAWPACVHGQHCTTDILRTYQEAWRQLTEECKVRVHSARVRISSCHDAGNALNELYNPGAGAGGAGGADPEYDADDDGKEERKGGPCRSRMSAKGRQSNVLATVVGGGCRRLAGSARERNPLG